MIYDDEKTVPCATCGAPTRMLGTKRCDGCWEVEHRLVDYLRNENARKRVLDALEVSSKATPEEHAAAAIKKWCKIELPLTTLNQGFLANGFADRLKPIVAAACAAAAAGKEPIQ